MQNQSTLLYLSVRLPPFGGVVRQLYQRPRRGCLMQTSFSGGDPVRQRVLVRPADRLTNSMNLLHKGKQTKSATVLRATSGIRECDPTITVAGGCVFHEYQSSMEGYTARVHHLYETDALHQSMADTLRVRVPLDRPFPHQIEEPRYLRPTSIAYYGGPYSSNQDR